MGEGVEALIGAFEAVVTGLDVGVTVHTTGAAESEIVEEIGGADGAAVHVMGFPVSADGDRDGVESGLSN